MCSASSSAGGRVCGVTMSGPRVGPIVRASRTTTQPDGVFHVVTSTLVPGLVGARRRDVDAERPEAERARLPVEQAAEHARRVEAGDAQPVDRAVRRHERAGVAVGQEGVLGDRRERRRCGRAGPPLPADACARAVRRPLGGWSSTCVLPSRFPPSMPGAVSPGNPSGYRPGLECMMPPSAKIVVAVR